MNPGGHGKSFLAGSPEKLRRNVLVFVLAVETASLVDPRSGSSSLIHQVGLVNGSSPRHQRLTGSSISGMRVYLGVEAYFLARKHVSECCASLAIRQDDLKKQAEDDRR